MKKTNYEIKINKHIYNIMITNIDVVYSKISDYMDMYPKNDCEYAGEFYVDKSLYCVDSFNTIVDKICHSSNITVINCDSSLMLMLYTKNGELFNIQYFMSPENEYYIAIF